MNVRKINYLENPIVSVIVITYNSAKYILETLESVKEQSYQNIELIISDDCSNDNTVEICEKWLAINSCRFIDATLIKVEKNSGIPANINRGHKKANGVWLKIIAGDDALNSDAIESVIKITRDNPKIEILLTQIEIFKEVFRPQNFISYSPENWESLKILEDSVDINAQIEYLLSGFHFPAPGFYMKNNLVQEVGGYDEEFKLIEDVPFFLKVLLKGKKIYFKPIPTIKYRKHSDNLTAVNDNIFQRYYLQYCQILFNESKQYGKIKFTIINFWNLQFAKMIFKFGNRGILCNILNKIRVYLNPRRAFSLFNL